MIQNSGKTVLNEPKLYSLLSQTNVNILLKDLLVSVDNKKKKTGSGVVIQILRIAYKESRSD